MMLELDWNETKTVSGLGLVRLHKLGQVTYQYDIMSCFIYKAGTLSCTLNDVRMSDDIYMTLDQVKAGDDTIAC